MTAEQLIKQALKAVSCKTLYIKGCFGAPMTQTNKKRYSTNYAYNKARAWKINAASKDTFGFDCVCLIKGLLWGWDGDVNKVYGGAVYESNGVPDIGETEMISKCTEVSADFTKIPKGAMLYMTGHCGIYIGDGLAVEASSKWKDGVQITAVKNIAEKDGYNSRTWERWGTLPWVDYPPKDEGYEQFKAYMDRYLKERAELPADDYALDAMRWAEEEGIIHGNEVGTSPKSFAQREEVVEMLYRMENDGVQ